MATEATKPDIEDAEILGEEARADRPTPLVTAGEAAERRFPASPARGAALPVDPLALIDRAVSTGANVETLNRLMDLQERHEQMQERARERAAKAAFDNALADAKAKIKPVRKGGHVNYTPNGKPTVDFRHARLQDIAEAVDPVLAEYGLAYRWRTEQLDGGLVRVTCLLSHRDGYSEENSLSGSRDDSGGKNNYQQLGSAITYLQRYTLIAALGLSIADDDDAQGAGRAEAPAGIGEDQAQEIREALDLIGLAADVVCRAEKVSDLSELPADRFGEVMGRLRKTAKDRGVRL